MKMKEDLAAEQIFVTPVFINVDELQTWCIKNKIKNTGASRSKNVVELAINNTTTRIAVASTKNILCIVIDLL